MPQASDEGATTVTVYCRSWCGDCHRAKRWLDDHGIEFVEVDVELDDEAGAFAASLNGGRLHTPTIVCDRGVCVDFRPDRLEELFGIS